MDPVTVFVLTAVIAVATKTLAWAIQLRTLNAGLVDTIWAWTLGGLALVYAIFGSAPLELRLLLAAMGGFWGLRLGWHLWQRNHGKPEDWRYARFRKEWGADVNRNMFWFFQFQNVFTLILSALAFMPVAYRVDSPGPVLVLLAIAIWIVSVVGETAADRQMERFRRNPANKGRICRDGLWRYSRHPNYFFECLHWAAYVPLAIGAPWGWVTLAAPVVMAALLIKLSGVPMLEAEMLQSKKGYADYMRSTSMLIPWPPKRS